MEISRRERDSCLACVGFALAYEGLQILIYPGPFAISTGFNGFGATMQVGGPGFSVAGKMDGPAIAQASIPEGRNFVLSGGKHIVAFGDQPLSIATASNGVMVGFGSSQMHTPPPPVAVGEIRVSPPEPWTRFLLLATSRMQLTVPIYLCIICVCWVVNHFREASEQQRRTLELESRLSQANLQALKMQLQPHFLFNTLNAISSLIHECPKAADDMIGSLSQFLRRTLEIAAKNEVPLNQELEFIERYLDIEQTRFGDRLRIERDIDSQSADALVPPLILQPLVENAVRYGIEPRESGGKVVIRVFQSDERLHLEVSDDGDGFSGQLLGIRNGIGLSNTKARLEELYGEQHQFKLVANQPKGACVKIEIPTRFAPPGLFSNRL
jgi:two-component sensor histidine kinase